MLPAGDKNQQENGGLMTAEWLIEPGADLIEPVPVPDIYVDQIGAIERIDSVLRVYYCTAQNVLGAREKQRIVAAKLILPISAVRALRLTWARALAEPSPRLVLAHPHH